MSRHGNDYRLDFSALEEGNHSFDYEVGNGFTELFPEAEMFFEPRVAVHLSLEKSERMMVLHFTFRGEAKTLCDRCLQTVVFPVDIQDEIIVRTTSTSDEGAENEENLWWVSEKETSIDLAAYFYEVIVLERPLQVFCPDDANGDPTCNPEMLDLYERMSQAGGDGEDVSDPRWEALRALKDKMSD